MCGRPYDCSTIGKLRKASQCTSQMNESAINTLKTELADLKAEFKNMKENMKEDIEHMKEDIENINEILEK